MKENVSANINVQFWIIVVSLAAGVGIALIYDAFRGWRRVQSLRQQKKRQLHAPKGKWQAADLPPMPEECGCANGMGIHLQDFMFWLIYVVITYLIFYFYHYGAPQGYVFLGEGLGVYLYYRIVKDWGRCFFTCALWQICTIIGWILQLILLPFRVICGNFIKILKIVLKSVKIIFINH